MRRPPSPRRVATRGLSTAAFLALVACAAIYVGWSSRGLPPLVASHFGAGGAANGFMPRGPYVGFMLVVVVLLPAIVGLVPNRAFRAEGARINLPNAAYWLAPERRGATIESLSYQMRRFATLLLGFLCYAHGLVIQANESVPPALAEPAFVGGLAAFLVATLVWVLAFMLRYRKVPG